VFAVWEQPNNSVERFSLWPVTIFTPRSRVKSAPGKLEIGFTQRDDTSRSQRTDSLLSICRLMRGLRVTTKIIINVITWLPIRVVMILH